MATINTTGAPSSIGWYDIWEAMVELEGMCTRNGKDGVAYALGEYSHISILLLKAHCHGSRIKSADDN